MEDKTRVRISETARRRRNNGGTGRASDNGSIRPWGEHQQALADLQAAMDARDAERESAYCLLVQEVFAAGCPDDIERVETVLDEAGRSVADLAADMQKLYHEATKRHAAAALERQRQAKAASFAERLEPLLERIRETHAKIDDPPSGGGPFAAESRRSSVEVAEAALADFMRRERGPGRDDGAGRNPQHPSRLARDIAAKHGIQLRALHRDDGSWVCIYQAGEPLATR